jgi:hypothetical protein
MADPKDNAQGADDQEKIPNIWDINTSDRGRIGRVDEGSLQKDEQQQAPSSVSDYCDHHPEEDENQANSSQEDH